MGMSRHEVARRWVNQSHARGSNGGSFYFEGDTIYSYGRHFPLARFVRNADGAECVLLNCGTYSVTTAGHKGIVWRALDWGHGRIVFQVPSLRPDHKANLASFRRRIYLLADHAKRPRIRKTTRAQLESACLELVGHANQYSYFFDLGERFEVPTLTTVQRTVIVERVGLSDDCPEAIVMDRAKELGLLPM